MPWTYYINDLSGNVLAVYHGRQVNRPVITGCAAPLTVINPLERRVYMYPVEYRSYGPDGVNVIFERDNNPINYELRIANCELRIANCELCITRQVTEGSFLQRAT